MKKLICLTTFIFLLSINLVKAANWIGGDGVWEVPGNWDCNCLPSLSEPVYISNDSKVTVNGSAQASSITIYSGSSLVISTPAGCVTHRIENYGHVINHGTITIPNSVGSGIVNWVNAEFVNHKILDIQDIGNGYGIHNLGVFTNAGNGEITISNIIHFSGIYNYGGFFTNSGQVEITNIDDNGISNQAAATFINKGPLLSITDVGLAGIWSYGSTIENQIGGQIIINETMNGGIKLLSGSTFNNDDILEFGSNISGNIIGCNLGSTFNNLPNGFIQGAGHIYYCNLSQQGTISPGFSPGVLSVEPSLTLTGVLNIEIAGTGTPGASDGYDQLRIIGSGTLGGELNISLLGGYSPNVGDIFTILTCTGGCSGVFGIVNFPTGSGSWAINYNANNVTVELLSPLPVELISFSGKHLNGQNILTWQTGSEKANEDFVVQRSEDAETWEDLATVQGKGFSIAVNSYNYNDQSPLDGTNFYRLLQKDYDGTITYSDIISVVSSQGVKKLRIYPNPVTGILSLVLPKAYSRSTLSIKVLDQLGRVAIQTRKERLGNNLDVSSLEPGIYVLIANIEGKIISQRFLKTH